MTASYGAAGAPAMSSGKMFNDKAPKGYKTGSIQQFTPEQLQLFQSLFSNVSPDSFLGKLAGGDQSQFEEMEAPALRQFGEIQGGLASRFSGMGMGARSSSGFQNTANQASSDFAQQLQSNRTNLRSQAIKDLMGMSGDLLNQRPYERTITEKPKSGWQQFANAFGAGAGQGAGKALTGWATGGF